MDSIHEKSFLLIEYEFNSREILGIESFTDELRLSYHLVQARPKHISAASEGGEIWLTVFINLALAEFILQNVAWDLVKYGAKKFFLRPLLEALGNLQRTNEPVFSLRMIKLKFRFDDIDLYVGGITGNYMSIMASVFSSLFKNIETFQKEVDLPLTKIELPITYYEGIDKPGYSKFQIDTTHNSKDIYFFNKLWKLTYRNGLDCKIYDFDTQAFSDCY